MPITFTAKDQTVLIKYLLYMKHTPIEIHKLLTAACGPGAADYRIVKDLSKQLEEGKDISSDDQNGGDGMPELSLSTHQQGPTDPAFISRMESLIMTDVRISVERLAEQSMMSTYNVQKVITDVLGLKRVCQRWVPKLWTPEQRSFRVRVARQLWTKYIQTGDSFLEHIIVGDESFVHYYAPDSLNAPSQRKCSRGFAIDKYVPQVEHIPITYVTFFDHEGLLLQHQVPEEEIMTPEYYARLIRDELTLAVKKKRKYQIEHMLLLHDNTPDHLSMCVQTVLNKLNLHTVAHPPASPDMEPHEYFFFNFLAHHLESGTFHNAHSIHSAVTHHSDQLSKADFKKAFKKLPERWDQIVESRGLYIL